MNPDPQNLKQWRRLHFEIEKNYAQRIMNAPAGSTKRQKLFLEGYDKVINEIINKYNPGGGGTKNTDMVMKIIKKMLPAGKKVLDIGCGQGNLVFELIQNYYLASGLDVSQKLIDSARKKLRKINADNLVECAEIANYSSRKKFDLIVMDNVIEHIAPDEINAVLEKCNKLLNKNGQILILTPHKFSGPHDISRYFLKLGDKAQGFHLREFSFTDLKKELLIAGFEKTKGCCIHPKICVTKPTEFCAGKNLKFEKLFSYKTFSWLLKICRPITKIFVAILFPAVITAEKR